MMSARLYVGGIGCDVNQHMLSSKFASFGSVTDAEVKEKLDPDGSVTQRFAYVNIESTQKQLEECFRLLNGSTWQGSNLRVELAKESFLDRLRRERAKNTENSQVPPKDIQSHSIQETEKRTKPHTKEYEVIPNEKMKRKVGSREAGDLFQAKKHEGKKKNKDEEKMMASFKSFSDIWADTDEDEDDNDDDAEFKMSNKKKRMLDDLVALKSKNFSDDKGKSEVEKLPSNFQDKRHNWGSPSKPQSSDNMETDAQFKTITKYNPTLQEHQQFRLLPPEVQKENVDGQVEGQKTKEDEKLQSTCFSLLSMFNKMNDKEQSVTKAAKKESIGKAPAQLPLQKSHPFFLSSDDQRIQHGVSWMLEYTEDNIVPEFEAIESDLYDVIKTRCSRARNDLEKKLALNNKDHRKKIFSKNRLQKASVAVIEEQNYDHGWRMAKIILDDKKTGGSSKKERSNRDNMDQGEETHSEGSTQKNGALSSRDGSSNPDFLSKGTHHRGRGRGRDGFGRGRGSRSDRGQKRRGGFDRGQGFGNNSSQRKRGTLNQSHSG